MAEENELPPELRERVQRSLDLHKHTQEQAFQSSVGFHEKLAVLTAGSLALAVSGAVEFHKLPLASARETHWLFVALTFAAVCLWLSLMSSITHNYVETRAMHESTDAALSMVTVDMFWRLRWNIVVATTTLQRSAKLIGRLWKPNRTVLHGAPFSYVA